MKERRIDYGVMNLELKYTFWCCEICSRYVSQLSGTESRIGQIGSVGFMRSSGCWPIKRGEVMGFWD